MPPRVAISSGHGKHIRGASGYLDEVDEARLVVEEVADLLHTAGASVTTFHDNTSTTQSENLDRIVDWHNSQDRDLDVSVHFNAYQTTSNPMGTECLYVTQQQLAADVALAISNASGLKNRGPKKRTDLAFLNNTSGPAILIETCFVDSSADAELYGERFHEICAAIAEALSGQAIGPSPEPPELPEPPEQSEQPTIGRGDVGPAVADVQRILGVPADGVFGAVTEGAVKGYQAAWGLDCDGIVGPNTWTALNELDARKLAGSNGLAPELIVEISRVAENSAIARYSWRDRGVAPAGYTAGVACAFALALTWLKEDDPAAFAMAQSDRGNPATDALTWYGTQFASLGMSNSEDGPATLRHLFALILGLGMRESSGRYCEGRDMSASNVSADTAEAGLFQTSWNIRSCSPHIPPLLLDFWENPNGFLDVFCEGVTPDSNDLPNYGTGDGAKYQFLSKYAPSFHTFVTGIGLRYLRQHWGPINREEVELKSEADAMLREVQDLVEGGVSPPTPQPEVPTITITVDPPGSARVIIIGAAP